MTEKEETGAKKKKTVKQKAKEAKEKFDDAKEKFDDAKEQVDDAKDTARDGAETARSIYVGETTAAGVTIEMGADKLVETGQELFDKQWEKRGTAMERKMFGIGEKGAQRAKVFFILLTGALALVEASIIVTSCERTVLVDMESLDGSVISNLLPIDTEDVADIVSKFNQSDYYPECLGGPGLNRTGFTFDPQAPPPPPPFWTTPQAPPPPPYWEVPQGPPPPPWTAPDGWYEPPSPPLSEEISNAVTAASVTNLWFSDSTHTACKDDKLFQGTATVDDCHPGDVECREYIAEMFGGAPPPPPPPPPPQSLRAQPRSRSPQHALCRRPDAAETPRAQTRTAGRARGA